MKFYHMPSMSRHNASVSNPGFPRRTVWQCGILHSSTGRGELQRSPAGVQAAAELLVAWLDDEPLGGKVGGAAASSAASAVL